MFKTVVIAALGFAAASANFLGKYDERFLQNVTQVAAACSVNATTGVETGCNTAGFCCAVYTRNGAAGTPANLCVPTDFIGQNLSFGGGNFTFSKCASPNVTAAAPARTACAADATCGAGQCCANVTLTAGNATVNGTATRRFCTAGTAATTFSAAYSAASWAAGNVAQVRTVACTPNAATTDDGSFGSYIKASVMMVVAVLSVAMF